MSDINVIITPNAVIEAVITPNVVIETNIISSGPRGEQGERGIDGGAYTHPDTHPASMIVEDSERVFLTSAEKDNLLSFKEHYVHTQMISSKEWVIDHDLKKYPSVSITDSAGSLVMGDITYTSISRLIVNFTSEFSGNAYLN